MIICKKKFLELCYFTYKIYNLYRLLVSTDYTFQLSDVIIHYV